MKIKDILYISSLSSERLIDEIHEKTGGNPGYAAQKFNRLLVLGLIGNDIKTIVLSNPPITPELGGFWYNNREIEKGVTYRYIPFVNKAFIKHVFVFTYTFFYVVLWGIKHHKNKAIVCDVLSISACMAALMASKIVRVKSVGIVTDIYDKIVGRKVKGIKKFKKYLAGKLQAWYSTSFTHYVLLTEEMKYVVNPRKAPYIVLEAVCDDSLVTPSIVAKNSVPIVMYAGGLDEKYGLKALVDGFREIDRDDIRLVIYGSGPYAEELKRVCSEDKRVSYKGVVSNNEIVQAEQEATLLVNPRFTKGDFTRYSFPSKNMEYMVSGTPLLTTKLPGIPSDHYSFVYFFDEETAHGYGKKINEIVSLPKDILEEKGKNAQAFVSANKNYLVQSKRIINLLEQN